MSSAVLGRELRRYVDSVIAERDELLARVEEEQRNFESQMATRREELARLNQVLDAARTVLEMNGESSEMLDQPPERVAERAPGAPPRIEVGGDVGDTVYRILKERGEPMHYTELLTEAIRRGHIIAGKRPAATLLARLVKDPRFVRPRRGTYVLAEDAPGVHSVGVRRSRRAPRRKRS